MVHTIHKKHHMFQNLEAGQFIVHWPRRVVMYQPGTLVGPYHGHMTINAPIFLVGKVHGDFRIFLIELPVGILEIFPVGPEVTYTF